jgi:hypothetical protein
LTIATSHLAARYNITSEVELTPAVSLQATGVPSEMSDLAFFV